ncbi:hypothetical protein [Desulfovulcanus sp.]
MSKREKIILAIAVIVITYGLYSFVVENSKKNSPEAPKTENFSSLTRNTLNKLSANKLDPKTLYILELINQSWENDPFIKNKFIKAVKVKKADDVHFEYTGYVEMGSTRIAIINGREYTIGENLEIEGYTLKNIYPHLVIIKGPGYKNEISVPYQEEIILNTSDK